MRAHLLAVAMAIAAGCKKDSAKQPSPSAITVKAIGDLDCDGVEAEHVLVGTIDAQGNLVTSLAEPTTDD